MFPIRLGCSGWYYEDWKRTFYGRGLKSKGMLPSYAEVFDTVEINSTFYRLPATVEITKSWIKKTPEDFFFAVKFPRQITHSRETRLEICEDDIAPFFQLVVEPLVRKKKLGPILIQFPYSFTADYELLEKLFSCLPQTYPYTVEFRHPSWVEYLTKTTALCESYHVAYCIVSERILPPITPITTDFAYIRWHGLNDAKDGKYLNYNYSYSLEQLGEWVPKIRDLAEQVRVFGYFNNHPNGQAPANCNQIKRLLGLPVKKPKRGQRQLDKYFK
ncbi:MAG: DUF72 domain-containing protein [Promethearchaeota archaeon]|nr:MAG: DUF72 domain-containing protein [Candidatus Lokiarchaeota archaeon]